MKLTFIIFALQLAVGGLLGRLFIPVFRKLKTGKFEIYIGDRFKQDGSEPRGGGALMLFCFVTACFASAAADGFNADEIRAAAFTAICLHRSCCCVGCSTVFLNRALPFTPGMRTARQPCPGATRSKCRQSRAFLHKENGCCRIYIIALTVRWKRKYR